MQRGVVRANRAMNRPCRSSILPGVQGARGVRRLRDGTSYSNLIGCLEKYIETARAYDPAVP
jgi:hypothetical protein